MKPVRERIYYGLCRCFGFIPVLLGEYHPETSAVEVVKAGAAAERPCNFPQPVGDDREHGWGCLIAEHRLQRCIVSDIEHNDVDMLPVRERPFHVVGVCAVLEQAGERINIILRALYADADDKQRERDRKAFHQLNRPDQMENDRQQAEERHWTERDNPPQPELSAVVDNIAEIHDNVEGYIYVEHAEEGAVSIALLHGKHQPCERIGDQQQEGDGVRQPEHCPQKAFFPHDMPGIGQTDDKHNVQRRLGVMNQQIAGMYKIKCGMAADRHGIEQGREDIEMGGKNGADDGSKKHAVGQTPGHFAENRWKKQQIQQEYCRDIERDVSVHDTGLPFLYYASVRRGQDVCPRRTGHAVLADDGSFSKCIRSL